MTNPTEQHILDVLENNEVDATTEPTETKIRKGVMDFSYLKVAQEIITLIPDERKCPYCYKMPMSKESCIYCGTPPQEE